MRIEGKFPGVWEEWGWDGHVQEKEATYGETMNEGGKWD